MIGIDLGTTNSLVCVWEETGVRILKNRFGESMTPSVVSFDADGTVYVGKTAKERLITHPEVTFREFKRDMGKNIRYAAYDQVYTPEDLSALVLKQLKEDAEFELGYPVEEAVISVPAYFNDRQRAATRDAGLLAGLKVDRLINEPSSAALLYHMEHYDEDEMFIVFDFGGGTLDVSLVDSFDNIIEIQAIAGNNQLGGKDFNELIARDFCTQNGLSWNALAPQMRELLLRETEKLKMKLTDAEQAVMQLRIDDTEYLYRLDNQRMIDFSGSLFEKIEKVLTKLMNDSMVTVNDISRVIMVGGSSRMPVVRQFVSRLFQGRLDKSGNPDEIVCAGTGVLCGIRQRKDSIRDVVLSDICPFTLGVGVKDNLLSPIISRNQILPCSRTEFYTTAEDYLSEITIPVYQGEKRTASENLLLEKITMAIPPMPRGEIRFKVCFSYDINGLFDIDIDCMNSGACIHKELNSTGRMSAEEIRNRKAVLEERKIHPRDVERNRCLLEQANALYVECNQEQQKFLFEAIGRFEKALDGGSAIALERAYRIFTVRLSLIRESMFSFHDFDRQKWDQPFDDDEAGD